MHLVSRQLREPPRTFRAYQRRVRLLHQVRGTGLLVALGEDDPGVNPYLKVFDLDQNGGSGGGGGDPALLRVSRAALSGRISEPTFLCAHKGQTLMAIAYDDGSVILHRGDVRRERGSRQKVLIDGGGRAGAAPSEKISGMTFRSTNKATLLYVATERSVKCFCLSDRAETCVTLDNVGCSPGLAIPAENMQDTHFVTGRQDAVYCYTPEGRGQCYAFEGQKVIFLS